MDNMLVLETDRAKIQISPGPGEGTDIATALAGYYNVPTLHLVS